jgi:hypothetical protein
MCQIVSVIPLPDGPTDIDFVLAYVPEAADAGPRNHLEAMKRNSLAADEFVASVGVEYYR